MKRLPRATGLRLRHPVTGRFTTAEGFADACCALAAAERTHDLERARATFHADLAQRALRCAPDIAGDRARRRADDGAAFAVFTAAGCALGLAGVFIAAAPRLIAF